MLESFFYIQLIFFLFLFVWGIKSKFTMLLFISSVLMVVLGGSLLAEGLDRETVFEIVRDGGQIKEIQTATTNVPATPVNLPYLYGHLLLFGGIIAIIFTFVNLAQKWRAKKQMDTLGFNT